MAHSHSQPQTPLSTDQLLVILRNGRKLGPWSAASTPNLRIITNEPNLLIVTIPIDRSLSNSSNKLHGGAIATMIDVLTSAAVLAADPRNSVTVDLHMTCISSAPVRTTVTVESRVEHVGRSMVFASCRVYAPGKGGGDDGARGRRVLIATGSHTKKVVGAKLDQTELANWAGPPLKSNL